MNLIITLLFCIVSSNLYSTISAETYTIHVKLADKKFDDVKGYLSLELEFKDDKKKKVIPLTRDGENLKSGGSYKFAEIIENPIEQIKVANLLFKEASAKRFIPFRSKPKIYVENIEIEPVYIANSSVRKFKTKRFCSRNKIYEKVESEQQTSFIECNFFGFFG